MNHWLFVLFVAILLSFAVVASDDGRCQHQSADIAGCLPDSRSLRTKAEWISVFVLQEDQSGVCAQQCRNSYFTAFAILDGDNCFCSHHHDLSPTEADCIHSFHHVGCVDTDDDAPLPPSTNNLCPDPKRFYCQTKHSLKDRITNFMSFMTLDDKIKTMGQRSVSGKYWDKSPLVARDYLWWSESLHGLEPNHVPNGACGKVCPTQFAEANALSCSWNASLWHATATAISTEARAYFNQHANGGLTFYAPNINLASHPLWGRVMETPGEDPYLTSVYAKEYIAGLQGDHPKIIKAASTAKHFIGHFFEGEHADPWSNGTSVSRIRNDTRYTLQDLEQYYLPPFRAALKDAKAESLMCAYQSVNGVPMCANGFLINRVVREEWNWTGFVVSDCDAIQTMTSPSFHSYSLDASSSVYDGVRAGCDQNCGDNYHTFGKQAVKEGLLSIKQIDTSIRRQLRALFRLGLFDPMKEDPYASFGWDDVGTDDHKNLALEGSRQSIVLLKNGDESRILPLSSDQRIVLAGPMYNATAQLLGNYYGSPCLDGSSDCLPSIDTSLETVVSFLGVPTGCVNDTAGIPEVLDAAKAADVVVLALGGVCHESEGADRKFLQLPGSQMDLFQAVYATGIPIVVVIINGGPYAIEDIKVAKGIAILQAGFPGQAGAIAIAEILTGTVNPSGKLTTTIYPASYANGEPMAGTPWMNSNLRPDEFSEGRSYMFYTGTPVYPFGYGLSYTTFSLAWGTVPSILEWRYEDLANDDERGKGNDINDFHIRLTNTGTLAGREVVQAYWFPSAEVDPQLQRQLFGFQTAFLQPGENTIMTFSAHDVLKSISTVTPFGDRVVRPGYYGVSFSRGYGDILKTEVKAIKYTMVRKFPTPWVEQNEVVADACVEGTSEVLPHTEAFLMAYKEWKWVHEHHWLQHVASKKCLTFTNSTNAAATVNLQRCQKSLRHQEWHHLEGRIHPQLDPHFCLVATATSSSQVRRPIGMSRKCSDTHPHHATRWNLTEDGLLQNLLAKGRSARPTQQGLCMAARSEGRFNYHS